MTDTNFLWWRDGIIYQIYPRSFKDTNGDGIGDLPGITSELDYLQNLGVDAIWLSPVYPSPDKDFGYDVSDYENIDSKYGTLADFDILVAEAHQRGIHVVLDMVFNHTSDQHTWFKKSKESKQSPYRNWYMWQPPRAGKRKPNNWQSIFGGDGWEWDEKTSEYYFHMFVKEQPDLNWRSRSVQRAVLEVFRFWLDRGADGFRLDVFNAFFKNADLPDNPSKFGLRAFDRQQHIYDMDQPEMMPFLAELRELLDAYPDRYAVGETFLSTPSKAAGYIGKSALHAAFNFNFLEGPWKPDRFLNSILIWESALGADKWPNYVLNNHDQPRSSSRYRMADDDLQAKLAAMLLLTVRGTPFLYYGEEIGMRDISLKRSEILDPVGKKYWPFHKGRDGCRSPMQWNNQPNGGFSDASPWLRSHANYFTRNVAAQSADPNSLLNFYKQLITIRRSSPSLINGKWQPLTKLHPRLLAYLRGEGKDQILVLLNFSNAEVTCQVPALKPTWKMICGTKTRESDLISGEVSLSAFEGMILK